MGQLKWTAAQLTPPHLTPYVHWWLEHEAERRAAALLGEKELRYLCACITPRGNPACHPVARGEAPRDNLDDRYFGPGEGVIPWFLRPDGRNQDYDPDFKPWTTDRIELPQDGVILGIIDDGIAFAHERFRGRDGTTRFDYMWLQAAAFSGPKDLPFGRELLRHDINNLPAAPDEEAVYREAGLIDFGSGEPQPLAERASHGTAVLDTAAGELPGDDGKPVLMAVSLPTPIVHDTSGTFLDYFVMLGVDRILKRADWLHQCAGRSVQYHVVINFSFELTAGPKDGTSPLARRIEEAIKEDWKGKGTLEFTIPAGNHRQSRVHAHLESRTSESAWLTWHLQPDDRTPSFVEIWMPPYPTRPTRPSVLCEVVPPGYDTAEPSLVPQFEQHTDLPQFTDLKDGNRLLARAYYSWQPTCPTKCDGPGRERIVVVAPPTAADTDAPGGIVGSAGDWRLRLRDDAGLGRVSADLYVQRDDTLFGGRQRGRQSYFVDDEYQDYDPAGRPILNDHVDSGVTRRGTLNAYALNGQAQLVGAAEREALREMQYSGAGPTPAQEIPDYLAVVDESRVHWGTIAAGTFSGSKVLMTGTSLAAPRVARDLTRPGGAAASGSARTDRPRGEEVLKRRS